MFCHIDEGLRHGFEYFSSLIIVVLLVYQIRNFILLLNLLVDAVVYLQLLVHLLYLYGLPKLKNASYSVSNRKENKEKTKKIKKKGERGIISF